MIRKFPKTDKDVVAEIRKLPRENKEAKVPVVKLSILPEKKQTLSQK